MVDIKVKSSNDNPFYGLRNCLKLFQGDIAYLDAAWKEVKNNIEKRKMFFSLLFSIGDITARQHNIFDSPKDSGGNAEREKFERILLWMRENCPEQFYRFLHSHLFNEYTCFDLLFNNRIQTKGAKILKVNTFFEDKTYREELLKYIYAIINGHNDFDKLLVAKFLTLPRLSKRKGHTKMLPETKKNMKLKVEFLRDLSNLMKWDYTLSGNICNFKGYRAWRKKYNTSLESVLFSTRAIKDFPKGAFIEWLNTIPAQARFRVRNRVFFSKNEDESLKYPQLKEWFEEWEELKESKQQEQRILEEKVRQGQASEKDKERLVKVKKQAKVTIGATNFKDLYREILDGKIDPLKLESFIGKVNLPYNSLVIIDDSGSMRGEPFNFATFMAAVCLCKNPDDEGRNLLGFFNSHSHWHSYIDRAAEAPNRHRRGKISKISPTPFVDPLKSFYENYLSIRGFCNAVFESGCTYISSIPEGLKDRCVEDPQILDALKAYPVWTIISDGEWNCLHSPEASLNNFMKKCELYFGFRPFIVAIDINVHANTDASRFSGIENFIYIPSNPAQIEQFLTNFNDMDIADVYMPLQSLYRSNRYDIVRANTL